VNVSDLQVQEVAAIIGSEDITVDDIETRVVVLVQDPMLARRLIDWIPEAFGIVLISHMATVTLPLTFSAKNKRGDWVQFDLKVEPIFQRATLLAMQIFHEGPRESFSNIARRSALLDAANRALNHGDSLDGAVLSGPALIGIPAEVYMPPSTSIWRKFFR
jgi:hypothetical protein